MRTTIDLPDDLFRQVKARAALDGLKLKDLVTRYVQQGLRGDTPPAPPEPASAAPRQRSEPPPPRRSPLPVIPKASARGKIPALTNAELQSILDEEDAERANRPTGR